ncbi:MAG: gliding motility-associated C-terminal domain-containing protein [Bacteroidales bacterium]
MSNIKILLTYSILLVLFTTPSFSQIDGISFKDSVYAATFEHFFVPVMLDNSDSLYFSKQDTSDYEFIWQINGDTKDLNINEENYNLCYQYTFGEQGVYNVSLEVIDMNGVSYYSTHEVIVEDAIEVPNVFTPNGDDQNDVFVVKSSGNADNKLQLVIYNRNGELVYKQTARVIYWDGKLASGEDAAEGVYYYVISTQGEPTRTKKGFFHLFR